MSKLYNIGEYVKMRICYSLFRWYTDKPIKILDVFDSCYKFENITCHISKVIQDDECLKLNRKEKILKMKQKIFEDTINLYSELEYNWDSYNANPISTAAIKTALKIVKILNGEMLLSNNVSVFPMRDGGIQFEFGNDYELEIDIEGNLTYLKFINDKIVDSAIVSDISEFINKVKKLV